MQGYIYIYIYIFIYVKAHINSPKSLHISGESSILEKSLNPGLDSIGVRVPDFDFIRAIARGAKSALALTSANLSGQLSSVSVKDFENLWRHCAFVYDGGLLPSGRAGSTVVDLIKPGAYKILRNGRYVSYIVLISVITVH